jgi:hypothetical protein
MRMREIPKVKTMCSRQDFLFTGCRTFQFVYFTPNFHTRTFELQGLKEPFNPGFPIVVRKTPQMTVN